MNRSGRCRTVIVFLTAIAVGAGVNLITVVPTSLRMRKSLGLKREGPNLVVKLSFSPNRVEENMFDTNGDGTPDQWSVYIRDGEPWKCDYLLDDVNFDGTPDVWTVGIGEHHTAYKLFDDDSDGRPDRLGVTIGDFSDRQSWYNYQDLDLDGKFDKMYKMYDKPRKNGSDRYERLVCSGYVLLNDCWTRILVERKSVPTEAWMRSADGTATRLVFERGSWRVAP